MELLTYASKRNLHHIMNDVKEIYTNQAQYITIDLIKQCAVDDFECVQDLFKNDKYAFVEYLERTTAKRILPYTKKYLETKQKSC